MKKQKYTFLIEFEIKTKRDCNKLLKLVKQNKSNIKIYHIGK